MMADDDGPFSSAPESDNAAASLFFDAPSNDVWYVYIHTAYMVWMTPETNQSCATFVYIPGLLRRRPHHEEERDHQEDTPM